MSSTVIQLDAEKQGFRISGMQQARLATMLGQMLMAGIVARTKGAVASALIDFDAHEVYWPSPAEDDRWLQMLAACVPADMTDPNLHRISGDKLIQDVLKLMFPSAIPVMPKGYGPWGVPR